MNDEWIRWTKWNEDGRSESGQMPLYMVDQTLRFLRTEAEIFMANTKADHVVYGLKWFDKSGKLDSVSFHMLAMSCEEFNKKATALGEWGNCSVYALHAWKGLG